MLRLTLCFVGDPACHTRQHDLFHATWHAQDLCDGVLKTTPEHQLLLAQHRGRISVHIQGCAWSACMLRCAESGTAGCASSIPNLHIALKRKNSCVS